ncbi:GNAT family N-acetyltransferase [Shivajiella indica]|uniref:GNAT family N-acetyltransferase n=1 Tax=Shivajiella indica TaxID=872115 RepID=A0ABW5B894_9BACT
MKTLTYQTAETEEDFHGILQLQKENHLHSLESLDQGFVTVLHKLEDIRKMNGFAPHIIAKEGEKIAAYVLAMTMVSKEDVPVLIPMFDQFDQLDFKGKKVSAYNYLVVGQVCVGKDFRGMGVFDHLYQKYKETHSDKFDFVITEIATNNIRSLQAHKRVGFKEIHRFTDPIPMEWSIVVWDWKS